MEGKGFCLTCHTIGKTGALRFPDLAGVDARAMTRVPGLNDVEYFAQSMYEPTAYVVAGFPPAMPPINKPPIALTDQEILCVIAYLQSLGGTPTVTLQTKHHYNSGAAAPAGRLPQRLRARLAGRWPNEDPRRPRGGRRVGAPSLPPGQSADVGRRLVGGDLRPHPIRIHGPDSRLRRHALHGNHLARDPGVRVLQRGAPRRSLPSAHPVDDGEAVHRPPRRSRSSPFRRSRRRTSTSR